MVVGVLVAQTKLLQAVRWFPDSDTIYLVQKKITLTYLFFCGIYDIPKLHAINRNRIYCVDTTTGDWLNSGSA